MSRSVSIAVLALGLGAVAALPLLAATGVGRPATPAEIKAWDTDVRPDFTGLPQGSGSVDRGQVIWEAQCESCHGTFGESNEVFTPVAGGTTKADQLTGHVKSLTGPSIPQRTTLMKLSNMSTLFDYIRRAMPWNAPKSLSDDEVYAVTAYVLYLNDVVSDDFVLDQDSIKQVQQRLPNRNGMTRDHSMWDIKAKPDTANKACMKDCAASVAITSTLPDYARNAHGNLADQMRAFGPIRGVVTDPNAATAAAAATGDPSRLEMAQDNGCTGCHGIGEKVLGPSFRDVAKLYADKPGSAELLTTKVMAGGAGAWGDMPMPPQPELDRAKARELVDWILAGAN